MTSASKGFTLLELLMVMLIISIAGSLVFMNLGRGGDRREAAAFAKKMVTCCKKARGRALLTGVPTFFKISSDDRQCWISNTSGNDINRQSVLHIPESIVVEAEDLAEIDPGVYGIGFYPDGSSSGGELAVRYGELFTFIFRIDRLTSSVSVHKEDEDV